jgi:starch phosphorylase
MYDQTAPLRESILHRLTYHVGKDPAHATTHDWRLALSLAVRDRIVDSWFAATRATYDADAKRVYYLSMEFLIGRLLEDALTNLQLESTARLAVAELGLDFDTLLADEPDAALGNGGLGRLAACFMESLSTLGCPAYGYGIRYEHGLFRQGFDAGGRQTETPENWLQRRNVWEFKRPETAYPIGFGGEVRETGDVASWAPSEAVMAVAHDTPMVGWQGRWTNTLRLWAARAEHPIDLDAFNQGHFVDAAKPEMLARTLSRVLYPDDSTDAGLELRLKQEFFFTAASLRDILHRFDQDHDDITKLPSKVAIQLNDTHPAIAGPELVRLLSDERGMRFADAVETARATLSYTNHTLLPEALETWSEELMTRLLPRHMTLIERIDAAHVKAHPKRKSRARDGQHVNMGTLSFIMAHKVNGVSALHTDLMKQTVFEDLHRLHPERIVNQTNGVTPRRWLLSCNPRLSGLISERIGQGWVDDLERLATLEPHMDADFMEGFGAAKRANKVELSNWVQETQGLALDPEAMFDVQIKRIHEYKRQHLNILETIALWLEIRANPNKNWTPRVKFFAGKAAPAYVFAKEIIHLINAVARVVNSDPVTNKFLKVAFLPNYNVTLAERLIPAADLSEQISTAGKEASGTGNMKFALNGALTVGTLDGANVEIRQHVGAGNFFLFGMEAHEVMARREIEGHAAAAIAADPRLAAALAAIHEGVFSPDEPDRFHAITENLRGPDYFLVCSDFTDYWRAQREIDEVFTRPEDWMQMAALNTARSGWFSSDRTIRGYMRDVWGTRGFTTLTES